MDVFVIYNQIEMARVFSLFNTYRRSNQFEVFNREIHNFKSISIVVCTCSIQFVYNPNYINDNIVVNFYFYIADICMSS